MTGSRRRAVDKWDPSDREPLVTSAGDVVTVGRRDTDWPGFLWCTDGAGVAGWVPEEILVLLEDERARLTEDYSAVELAVKAGDEVEAVRSVAGWHWSVADNGDAGWLPEKVLTPED